MGPELASPTFPFASCIPYVLSPAWPAGVASGLWTGTLHLAWQRLEAGGGGGASSPPAVGIDHVK